MPDIPGLASGSRRRATPGAGFDRRAVLAACMTMLLPARFAFAESAGSDELDRSIGTMLMLGFRGAEPDDEGARLTATQIASGQIGGVLFFEDNLRSPSAVRALTDSFRSAAGASKPLLAVDQEGGVVTRLRAERGFRPLPSAKAVGLMTPSEAAQLYEATARELHDLGLNLNFAPVVDLDINPENPIIGSLSRSFGVDAGRVVERAKIFIEAHRRHHVLTTLKHFPGHGSSVQDSHRALPDITETWRETELTPYATLVAQGFADMIMVGHLVDGRLTEPGRPASLSGLIIHTLLRKQIGYDGVVVSDDMQMGALRRSYPPDEAILLGLQAGLDLFVFSNRDHPDPEMPGRFHRVVTQAIAEGRISRFRIAESARRIERLKQAIA